jgi:predicted Zn-dependent protease
VFSLAARDFLNSLAMARGEYAAALVATRELRAQMESLLGADAPILGFAEVQIAKASFALETPADGLRALESASALLASLEPQHPALVVVHRLRSELHLQAGQTDRAVSSGQEAVRRSSARNVHPIERGRAHLALAEARRAQGASAEVVREDLEKAAAAFAKLPQHADAKGDRVAELL